MLTQHVTTITCPTMPSNYPLNLESVSRCLKRAEAEKAAQGEARCAKQGWGYIGAAFSTWGGLGPGAKSIFNRILRIASNGLSQRAKSEKCAKLTKTVSVALARGMIRQLRARDRIVSEVGGQGASDTESEDDSSVGGD